MPKAHGNVGLVLAGGGSRRFGRDKALVEYQGKALWQHAARLLRPWTEHVVLLRTQALEGVVAPLSQWADRTSGSGPLPAIVDAMDQFPAATWLIAPCDMPLLKSQLYGPLLDCGEAAACYQAAGRLQPLVSIFRRSCQLDLRRSMQESGQESMTAAFQHLGAKVLTASKEQEPLFLNVNTASHWQQLDGHLDP